MKHFEPVEVACKQAGSISALARMLGVKPPTIYEWLKKKRPVPPARCVELELKVKIPRWKFRPNDGHLIWPERGYVFSALHPAL